MLKSDSQYYIFLFFIFVSILLLLKGTNPFSNTVSNPFFKTCPWTSINIKSSSESLGEIETINFIIAVNLSSKRKKSFQSGSFSVHACMHAKSLQSCPTLCNPMDCSPPGSSVHGSLQARTLSGLPCPPPGDLPNPGIEPASLKSPALSGGFFTTGNTWKTLFNT